MESMVTAIEENFIKEKTVQDAQAFGFKKSQLMIDTVQDVRNLKESISQDIKPQISKFKLGQKDLSQFLVYADQVLFKSPI